MSIEDGQKVIQHEHGKITYSFCSDHCLAKFKKEPDSYIDAEHDKHPETEFLVTGRIYTCPMHPKIEQPTPGSCPKCSMAVDTRRVTPDEQYRLRVTLTSIPAAI